MRPGFEPERTRSTPTGDAARQFRAHLIAIVNSYSEVLFLKGWGFGAVVLGVTLLSPNVALAGIVAVLAAYAFARFVGMELAFLDSGFYTYNPLLVGLSLGYLFQLTPLTLFFLVTTGIAAFLITQLRNSSRRPRLSLLKTTCACRC